MKIEQIVLAGYHKHHVEGAPPGTPILERNQLEQPNHFLKVAPAQSGGRDREGFASLAHAMFGSAPMSFQYKYNETEFVIGPQNENWRASYIDSFARDLERELIVAENQDFEFNALLRRSRADKEEAAVAKFTLTGFKQPPTAWLAEPSVLTVAGRKDDERFIVDRKNEIYVLKNDGQQPLQSPEAASPGRTTALAYDPRRQRLLAWHSRENRDKNSISSLGNVVIACDIAKRAWEQMGRSGVSIGPVAIDAEKDVQYGLVLPVFFNAIHDLVVMNAQGAVLRSVPLSEPFFWDLDAGPPQAVFERGHLIVITPPQATLLPDGQERLVSQVIAINPASGQTFFTGRYFCD